MQARDAEVPIYFTKRFEFSIMQTKESLRGRDGVELERGLRELENGQQRDTRVVRKTNCSE
jgi:hypothetical protein